MTRRKELLRVGTFICVGVAAAAVHWGVAVGLTHLGGWQPLVANVAGWVLAMLVSFSGHHWLTFGDRNARVRESLPRFFGVSAAGFAVNEISYAALIHAGVKRYDVALAIILVAVAGITFIASRLWVFAHQK
jgi:putative flippase GtrA